MLNSIEFLLDLLRNKIKDDKGHIIPVIKRSYPLDKSPCICLDSSPGATVLEKHRIHNPYEYYVDRVHSYVNIHVYCDREDQREYILDFIREVVFLIESDNFTYCSRLRPDYVCSTLEEKCRALTESRLRASKSQCPNPEEYEYENIFTRHHVIRDTVQFDPAFDVDDLTKHPPLLHSVIRTSMIYDDYIHVGGTINDNIIQDTTIIGE